MKVVIVNADDKNIKTDLLSFSPLEGGIGEEQEKHSVDFNLLNPPFINPESSSEQAFGYTITLNQLSVSPTGLLVEKPCTFYYDCEKENDFSIFLQIDNDLYNQIIQIEQSSSPYEYEVSWRKITKPLVEYIYWKDQEKFVYYDERKKEINFDREIIKKKFTKEGISVLNLKKLDDEENSFTVDLDSFEVIGFKNENLLNDSIQIIPLNSKIIFNDTRKYVFSLLIEKKEDFPLDFFIKNIGVNNEGTPPSGGGSGTEEGGTGGSGTEEGGTGGLVSIDTITNDEIDKLFGIAT